MFDAVGGMPAGGVPTTVPVFSYCPSSAVPVLVQLALASAANEPITQMFPILSSVTVTFVSVTLPVLTTLYVHVTVDPTSTFGPGALSLFVPFVSFTRLMDGLAPK